MHRSFFRESLLIRLTTPLATIHLLRRPHAQTDPAAAEEGLRRPAVDAGVEVDVGAVLVRVGCAALRAERVSVGCVGVIVSDGSLDFERMSSRFLFFFFFPYQGTDS